MLYAIEVQRPIAAERTAPVQSISSPQSLALTKTRRIETIIYTQQTFTFSAIKKLPKNISIGSPETIGLTASIVATPRLGQSLSESARLFQPGNLQTGRLLQVNWRHPLTNGLVYLDVFDQLRNAVSDYPFMPSSIGGRPLLTIRPGTLVTSGPGGIGITMTNTQGGMVNPTGSTLRVPQTKGSMFFYVTADFAPNDSVAHYLIQLGRVSSPHALFQVIKYSDNNILFGWFTSGVSYRATVAATGLWAAGDTFMFGGTWNSSNVNAYIKGKLAGSLGSAPTTNDTTTSPAVFQLFQNEVTNKAWGINSGKNLVYYMAIWNRDLSAAECNYLNQNPYCFMTGGIPKP